MKYVIKVTVTTDKKVFKKEIRELVRDAVLKEQGSYIGTDAIVINVTVGAVDLD